MHTYLKCITKKYRLGPVLVLSLLFLLPGVLRAQDCFEIQLVTVEGQKHTCDQSITLKVEIINPDNNTLSNLRYQWKRTFVSAGGTEQTQFSQNDNEATIDINTAEKKGQWFVEVKANNCSLKVSNKVPVGVGSGDSDLFIALESMASCGNDGSIKVSGLGNGGDIQWKGVTSVGEIISGSMDAVSDNYSITNLPAGDYTVVALVKDCYDSATTTISESTAKDFVVTATTNGVSCFSGSDGSITLEITDAPPQLTYNWRKEGTPNFNPMSKNVTNLSAGTYYVDIKQGNCIYTEGPYEITQPPKLAVSITPSNIQCDAPPDELGAALATVTGGTGNKTYEWSNDTTGNLITNLEPGMYSVTVEDTKGCQADTSVEIIREVVPDITNAPGPVITVENNQVAIFEFQFTPDFTVLDFEVVSVSNLQNSGALPEVNSTMSNVYQRRYNLQDETRQGSVTYEVTPRTGEDCTGTPVEITVTVKPEPIPFFFPEAFTPNGDGANDYWRVTPARDDHMVVIMDRSGTEVFKGTLADEWSGRGCVDGVYYFIVTNPEGAVVNKGAITLLTH